MALKPTKPSKIARNRRKSEQRQQSQAQHQMFKEALARKAQSQRLG